MSDSTKELLDLADWAGRKSFSPGDRYADAAAALRFYAELVSALLHLDRHNYGVRHLISKDVTFDLDPESVIEAAKEEGWMGLEEAGATGADSPGACWPSGRRHD